VENKLITLLYSLTLFQFIKNFAQKV